MQLLSVSSKPRTHICTACGHNKTKAAERSYILVQFHWLSNFILAMKKPTLLSLSSCIPCHTHESWQEVMLSTLSAGLLHQIPPQFTLVESRILRRRSLGLLADFFEGNTSPMCWTQNTGRVRMLNGVQPYDLEARWVTFKHVNSVRLQSWRRLTIWQSPWYQRTGHKIFNSKNLAGAILKDLKPWRWKGQ